MDLDQLSIAGSDATSDGECNDDHADDQIDEAADCVPETDQVCKEFSDDCAREIADYKADVDKGHATAPYRCQLCPFRSFKRRCQLLKHLDYHV